MEIRKEDPYPSSTTRIYCNKCLFFTNHHRVYGPGYRTEMFEFEFEPDFVGEIYPVIYNLWQCAGCESATFEVMTLLIRNFLNSPKSEFVRDYSSEFFPPRSETTIERKYFSHVPNHLNRIYLEIINAYNSQAFILCSVGMRALLEGITVDRGVRGKNLTERIDGLKIELSERLVFSLHEFRFIGNEAIHELSEQDPGLLRTGIDILEDLLNYLYEIEAKAENFKSYRKELGLLDDTDLSQND